MRLLIGLCLLVAACAGPREIGGSPGLTATNGDLPQPGAAEARGSDRPYLIGPFDKLVVDVFGVEEMRDREIQVDSGGQLSFPLAGSVQASGKTPAQVAQDIAARLRDRYIRNPQVTVNLKETVGSVVTVDGQVTKPGLYPVIGRMTLVSAVATAGGTSEFARLQDVLIFRTVNGQRYVGIYNLDAIRRGAYPDPEVFANDTVVIGDSPQRRLFRDIIQASPLITTPLIYLINR